MANEVTEDDDANVIDEEEEDEFDPDLEDEDDQGEEDPDQVAYVYDEGWFYADEETINAVDNLLPWEDEIMCPPAQYLRRCTQRLGTRTDRARLLSSGRPC